MITHEIRTINNQDAKKLLNKNKKNRKISSYKVLEYRKAILKGSWQLNGQPIIISDKKTLIDGQQRLTALAGIEDDSITIEIAIISGISIDAFDTLDTGKARSASDLLSIKGINTQYVSTLSSAAKKLNDYSERLRMMSEKEIWYKKLAKLNKGDPRIKFDFQKTTLQNKDVYDYIHIPKYKKLFFDGVKKIKDNKVSLLMTPADTLYYYVLLHSLNKTKASEFCDQIITNTNIEYGSPIHLLTNRINGCRKNKTRLSGEERDAIVITAWNSYVQGVQLKQAKLSKDNISKIKRTIKARRY